MGHQLNLVLAIEQCPLDLFLFEIDLDRGKLTGLASAARIPASLHADIERPHSKRGIPVGEVRFEISRILTPLLKQIRERGFQGDRDGIVGVEKIPLGLSRRWRTREIGPAIRVWTVSSPDEKLPGLVGVRSKCSG